LEVSPPPGPGEEEREVSEKVDGVVGICATCSEERLLVLRVPAWGLLCEECSQTPEDDEEEPPTPTPEQARIAALEGALREVRKALRQEEMEGSRAAAIVEAALGEEEEGWARG
jgi:hypothetical protein